MTVVGWSVLVSSPRLRGEGEGQQHVLSKKLPLTPTLSPLREQWGEGAENKGRVSFLTRPCLSFIAGEERDQAALRAAGPRTATSGFLKRAPSEGRRIFFSTASRAAKASENAVIAISGRSTPWMSSET